MESAILHLQLKPTQHWSFFTLIEPESLWRAHNRPFTDDTSIRKFSQASNFFQLSFCKTFVRYFFTNKFLQKPNYIEEYMLQIIILGL